MNVGAITVPGSLAVLEQPLVDGCRIEENEHLADVGGTGLLHVARRIRVERLQGRVLRRAAPARDLHQHGAQRRLDGRAAPSRRSVARAHRDLIQIADHHASGERRNECREQNHAGKIERTADRHRHVKYHA
jgi:hypothetical protein